MQTVNNYHSIVIINTAALVFGVFVREENVGFASLKNDITKKL